MPANNFYPSLTTLIPVENIPENFGVFKSGLTQLFNHFYYKDLQITRSVSGDSAFYDLKILTYKRLAIEIPGTAGMALVLNPNFNENTPFSSSEFPISLGYRWDILKYSKAFEGISSFDFSVKSFFSLILDISGASNVELLNETITLFINDPNDSIQKFVDDFNAKYAANINNTTIEDIITQISTFFATNTIDKDIIEVIFDDYLNTDIDSVISNVEALFSKWLGNFTIENIETLLIPQASAAINSLTVSLEFPTKILRKVDPSSNEPIENPANSGNYVPGSINVDLGSILYSTEHGLELNIASNPINIPRCEILESGFCIEITQIGRAHV